jgi:hypothetical protein
MLFISSQTIGEQLFRIDEQLSVQQQFRTLKGLQQTSTRHDSFSEVCFPLEVIILVTCYDIMLECAK